MKDILYKIMFSIGVALLIMNNSYYNNINNVQNERVKLALQELINGLGITNNYVATFNDHNIEILMAYIIHLEEKIDSLNNQRNKKLVDGVVASDNIIF